MPATSRPAAERREENSWLSGQVRSGKTVLIRTVGKQRARRWPSRMARRGWVRWDENPSRHRNFAGFARARDICHAGCWIGAVARVPEEWAFTILHHRTDRSGAGLFFRNFSFFF